MVVFDAQNNAWQVIRRDTTTGTVVLFSPEQKSVIVTNEKGKNLFIYDKRYVISLLGIVLYNEDANGEIPIRTLVDHDYFRVLQDHNQAEGVREGVRTTRSDIPENIS